MTKKLSPSRQDRRPYRPLPPRRLSVREPAVSAARLPERLFLPVGAFAAEITTVQDPTLAVDRVGQYSK